MHRQTLSDALDYHLGHHEQNTLQNCLRVAAERFREHAFEFACLWVFNPEGNGLFNARAYPPLARQFLGQAEEADALARKLCGWDDESEEEAA